MFRTTLRPARPAIFTRSPARPCSGTCIGFPCRDRRLDVTLCPLKRTGHAVTDAVLGAVGAGDVGRHFPDTDPAWKGANSLELLRQAMALVKAAGYGVVNVDAVVIAQRPKLVPYVDAIRANLAAALECETSQISVKGKTNEGLDSMGAGESIAVHAVALLTRI